MIDRLPRCCSMHDPEGRRGIWFAVEDSVFKLFAGREGDDASVELRVGDVVTEQVIDNLVDCLEYGAWQQEDYGPDAPMPVDKFKTGSWRDKSDAELATMDGCPREESQEVQSVRETI